MGRWRQCRIGVGTTTRLDCTPPPAPPEQDEAAPVSRATRGWVAKEKNLGETTDLCERCSPLLDAMGNRGFSGAAKQPGAGTAQHTVPALILMGDWCALWRNHSTRTKCAGPSSAGHGRDRMRGATQYYVRPIAGGRLMGDPVYVTMVRAIQAQLYTAEVCSS